VVGVADGDAGDAVRAGPLDSEIDGVGAEDLPDAVGPSSTTSGPESVTTDGRVTGSIAPLRSRATYHGRRSMPCEEWPHSSAVTRLSASSAASARRDADRGEEAGPQRAEVVRGDGLHGRHGVSCSASTRVVAPVATSVRVASTEA